MGVHEKQQQIRCIACKGAPFPPTLPRPTVTILPLQLPLCELNTEKGQMEVSIIAIRYDLFLELECKDLTIVTKI